jgi:hypothetical protein
MVRVRASTSTTRPSRPCRITTRLASHARRWDVPAGTRAPSSRTDWPDCSGSARTSAIDVDHYLVALARGAGIDAVVQGRLREQRQGVRLLLDHRRRVAFRLFSASPLIQRLAGGSQRLHEQRADLRGQPPADTDGTVGVGIHVQRPAGVLQGSLPGLGLPVHSAPAAHEALDVLRCAGARRRQQPLFGLRGDHAGQLPDLRVGQLPAGERLSQQRQRAESARHSDVLASCAGGEPHPPAQPGGAGAEAGVPALAGVELADEVEEAGGGGVEVRRQLGDLVAQPVEFRGRLQGGWDVWRMDLHSGSPSCWGDSTPRISSHLRASRTGDSGRAMLFRPPHVRPPIATPVRAAGPAFARHCPHAALAVGRSCQAKISRSAGSSERGDGVSPVGQIEMMTASTTNTKKRSPTPPTMESQLVPPRRANVSEVVPFGAS